MGRPFWEMVRGQRRKANSKERVGGGQTHHPGRQESEEEQKAFRIPVKERSSEEEKASEENPE